MTVKELTYNLNQIDDIAHEILENVDSKIILFYGEMGSGKTTLINALLKSLGSHHTASSPTFSVINEYEMPNDIVYHFDLYRINSIEEAFNFGIEEYLYSKRWLLIEWPELIESLLPAEANIIKLESLDINKRSLKLTIRTEILT